MTALVHRHTHRVTYAECTIGDHVYYGRYLDLLEEARGEFLRSVGVSFRELQARGLALPVVECALRYHAPARYDDVVTVVTGVAALGRVRVSFHHRLVKGERDELVTATTVHACTGLDEKPRRLPEDLRMRLAPYLAPQTESGSGASEPSSGTVRSGT